MDMKWIWIENTHGKKDSMLTFAMAAFCLVFFKVLTGGNEWTIAGQKFVLTAIDATQIGALLVPTLGAYVARRNNIMAGKPNDGPEGGA